MDCGEGAHVGRNRADRSKRSGECPGSSEWSATDGARTLKMSSMATLKWLGAVCELDLPSAPRIRPVARAFHAARPPRRAPHRRHRCNGSPDSGRRVLLQTRPGAGRQERSVGRASITQPGHRTRPARATSYNARGYAYLRLHSSPTPWSSSPPRFASHRLCQRLPQPRHCTATRGRRARRGGG